MTICPNNEKCTAVSTTINPVTQTELVLVKRASMYENQCPSFEAIGKLSKSEPTKMTARKLTITLSGAFNLAFLYFITQVLYHFYQYFQTKITEVLKRACFDKKKRDKQITLSYIYRLKNKSIFFFFPVSCPSCQTHQSFALK